jgi:type II secretory pathway pseudopilin PulG
LAVVYALVVMSILGLLMTFIARQAAAARRLQDGRLAKLQATWLARAGLETAAARLWERGEPFSEELTDVAPGGRVTLRVEPAPGPPGTFRVISEAAVEAGGPAPARVTLSRTARRAQADGGSAVAWADGP